MTFVNFFKNYLLELLSVLMISIALFFFVNVQSFKSSLKKTTPEAFKNNEIVKIIKIIDGDEVLVESREGAKTIIRLLGIKSFDHSVSDPATLEYGKICFNFLKEQMLNKQVKIELPSKRIIDKKRCLIAYLFLKDKNEFFSVDIGKLLVEKGLSIVYNKYDFGKMKEYLDIEAISSQKNIGLWGNKNTRSRVELFKKIWLEEKLSND